MILIVRLTGSELAYMVGIFILAYNMCKAKSSNDFAKNGNSQAACAQSFAPWQQATIEIMFAISLTIACSPYIYNGVIPHAHPVRGESHNQRNTTGEVATTSSPFYSEPHREEELKKMRTPY